MEGFEKTLKFELSGFEISGVHVAPPDQGTILRGMTDKLHSLNVKKNNTIQPGYGSNQWIASIRTLSMLNPWIEQTIHGLPTQSKDPYFVKAIHGLSNPYFELNIYTVFPRSERAALN